MCNGRILLEGTAYIRRAWMTALRQESTLGTEALNVSIEAESCLSAFVARTGKPDVSLHAQIVSIWPLAEVRSIGRLST